jgi:hypothetical protein
LQTNKEWVPIEDNGKKLNGGVGGGSLSSSEDEDDIFSMASPWDKR